MLSHSGVPLFFANSMSIQQPASMMKGLPAPSDDAPHPADQMHECMENLKPTVFHLY